MTDPAQAPAPAPEAGWADRSPLVQLCLARLRAFYRERAGVPEGKLTVILNGIDSLTSRADLTDRALVDADVQAVAQDRHGRRTRVQHEHAELDGIPRQRARPLAHADMRNHHVPVGVDNVDLVIIPAHAVEVLIGCVVRERDRLPADRHAGEMLIA